ncbi:hypothetical protein [Galbitalea soli]|uniref:PilN domain-containing protein n=1 Tax=Galbitalea soli TaxID=1268042 RepID=A0A7C9PMY1_9MICO|nr:hypothetical protein [Galbitalea soli]NEM91205.1 hypothetical protein [Galbitalea soli]NYJ29894.1 hypothetical protein [Galbitalea soli]
MSTTVKTKPEKKAPGTRAAARSARTQDVLRIGGEPRVSLLPPEVGARKRARVLRRRLGLGLIGVVVVVAAGVALAMVSLVGSQLALTEAQLKATDLLAQQRQYGDVLKVKADVVAVTKSQALATAQEIAWAPYIADIQKTLPASMKITAFSAGIDAPFAAQPANVDPLQGPRIATLKLTVSTPQQQISGWLASLNVLPGFVDATPESVTLDQGSPDYLVVVDIHINDGALAKRFVTATK